MHRNRTWLLDPIELRTQRNRILPIEGGDGSTLSLDFTTGVLDPRLTFTRGTNATFINSSGLVQYADANYVQNSNDVTASGWSFQNGVTRSFDNAVVNPEGGLGASLVTASSSIGSSAVTTSSFTVNGGLTYTVSFWIRAGTATHALVGVYDSSIPPSGAFTPASALVISGPGSASGSSSIVISGLTSSWTRVRIHLSPANSGLRAVSIYPDAAAASGKSIYIWGVKWEAGHVANPTKITTGATAYYAPRFDHDPTTLAPKGLLIEGTATNLCEQGQYCWGSGTTISWSRSAGINVNSVNGTSGANAVSRIDGPDGGSLTGTSIFKDSGSTFVRLQYVDFAVQANTTYTWSAYVRAPSGGNPYIRLGAFNGGTWLNTTGGCTLSSVTITNTGGGGSVFNGVPSGSWVRVWVTFTTQAAQTLATIGFYPDANTTNAATMYVWGSQVETGSGPSSVILTGASQGTRNADNCYIYDTTSSGGLSWFKTATQGTFYVEMFKRSAGTAFAAAGYGTRGAATQDFMLYQAVGNNWLSFNWGADNIVNYTALSSPFLIKSAAALSPRVGTPTTADVLQSINGTAGTLNTSPNVTLPFTSDLFCIGSRGPASGTAPSQNYAETAIRRIKFFPFAMTAAQMNALTTL